MLPQRMACSCVVANFSSIGCDSKADTVSRFSMALFFLLAGKYGHPVDLLVWRNAIWKVLLLKGEA